ncbi:MAG TPA: CBS and ACT domain-containing protein [Ignavibacteriaceae bacterium]|nr:CBS and ACT domain-containing protein [Ignavibacteriaceae bacterium]
MIIREVMHPDPVTVSPTTKLKEAYKIMQQKNIRHLPVMDNDIVVGIVTDRDLRLATSRLTIEPFDVDAEIEKIMSHPVQFTHPSDPIEIATRTMRELKIGCLPVIEEMKLVGIVTGMDLLDALLLLTGIHRPSGRLDVKLPDRSGELARLTALLAERNINIHSILSYPDKDRKIRLVLRVGTIEMKILAEAICNAGFEVVWPVHIACVK